MGKNGKKWKNGKIRKKYGKTGKKLKNMKKRLNDAYFTKIIVYSSITNSQK